VKDLENDGRGQLRATCADAYTSSIFESRSNIIERVVQSQKSAGTHCETGEASFGVVAEVVVGAGETLRGSTQKDYCQDFSSQAFRGTFVSTWYHREQWPAPIH
jgi:hypothetical protein